MCGIAGIIGSFDKAQGEVLLKNMLKVIEHRGPDSNGLWSTDGFAFGMQRLSIIDLIGGDQPIWSVEGVGIVFNGEIYNFKNLRSNLEKKGVVFKTHSDTEVILQLYIQKGLEFVYDLEGMFGICLYDPRLQKVYCIRDRLGVKPLYYYQDSEFFAFGSEIKSLLEIFPKKIELNQQAIWDYLTLRYVPSPETMWQNICKLEPGHWLEYDLKTESIRIEKYWSLDFNSNKKIKTKNYEKEFENLFLEAVEKRLLASDVPVGILLSGGLDSSCVAAAAVELNHKNFHTFSIGFEEGGEFCERKYARKVADFVGSTHHEIVISQKQFINFLEEFVWYSDEPIADLASIPLYYLSKLASEHVKVVLSGEGSDEIFAGYNLGRLARTLSYARLADYLPKSILKRLPHNGLKMLGNLGYTDFLKKNASYISNVFSEDEKKKICLFQGMRSTKELIQSFYSLSSSSEPMDQLQQAYCHSWLVEDLLMKADKMSMAASLELRVPFLDHKLVEWAAKLPLEWKVGSFSRGFTTKHILRRFAAKRIPEEIINRPKQGFPVPAYKWVQNELAGWAKTQLIESPIQNYIAIQELEEIFQKSNAGSNEAVHKIWNLVILSFWLKKWVA